MAWEEGKNNKEKSKTGQKASQRKQIRETNCMYCDSSRKKRKEYNECKETRLQS